MQERRFGEMTTLETRLLSNEEVPRNIRYSQILEKLEEKPMTAKEVAIKMHLANEIPTSERNFTAPRLTELSQKGLVEPIGKVKCKYSGKMVSVYKIRKEDK